MPSRQEEVEALWRAVFGQPPSIAAPAEMLLQILIECLPPTPPFAIIEAIRGAVDREASPESR